MACSFHDAITHFDCQTNIKDRALQLCVGRNMLLPEDMFIKPWYIRWGGEELNQTFSCSAHLTYDEHT
jgi:hypothetical protein